MATRDPFGDREEDQESRSPLDFGSALEERRRRDQEGGRRRSRGGPLDFGSALESRRGREPEPEPEPSPRDTTRREPPPEEDEGGFDIGGMVDRVAGAIERGAAAVGIGELEPEDREEPLLADEVPDVGGTPDEAFTGPQSDLVTMEDFENRGEPVRDLEAGPTTGARAALAEAFAEETGQRRPQTFRRTPLGSVYSTETGEIVDISPATGPGQPMTEEERQRPGVVDVLTREEQMAEEARGDEELREKRAAYGQDRPLGFLPTRGEREAIGRDLAESGMATAIGLTELLTGGGVERGAEITTSGEDEEETFTARGEIQKEEGPMKEALEDLRATQEEIRDYYGAKETTGEQVAGGIARFSGEIAQFIAPEMALTRLGALSRIEDASRLVRTARKLGREVTFGAPIDMMIAASDAENSMAGFAHQMVKTAAEQGATMQGPEGEEIEYDRLEEELEEIASTPWKRAIFDATLGSALAGGAVLGLDAIEQSLRATRNADRATGEQVLKEARARAVAEEYQRAAQGGGPLETMHVRADNLEELSEVQIANLANQLRTRIAEARARGVMANAEVRDLKRLARAVQGVPQERVARGVGRSAAGDVVEGARRGPEELDVDVPGRDQATRELEQTLLNRIDALEEEAGTDPRTGLSNLRGEERTLEQRPPPEGRERVQLEMDLDNFKAVNDRRGLRAGDRYIERLAGILKDVAREEDAVTLARIGGDEFRITMDVRQGTDVEGLRQRFNEKVNARLAEEGMDQVDEVPLGATFFEPGEKAAAKAEAGRSIPRHELPEDRPASAGPGPQPEDLEAPPPPEGVAPDEARQAAARAAAQGDIETIRQAESTMTSAGDRGRQAPVDAEVGPRGELPSAHVFALERGDIELAPQRFQYKTTGRQARGEALSGVDEWDYNKAGVMSVWWDEDAGQWYVVNGHNRMGLAQDVLPEDAPVNVMELHVGTPAEARAVGAAQNIAEGRGSAIDAAKYFRDSGIGPEEIREHNIPMTENKVQKGLSLARLPDAIFDDVVQRRMKVNRGVILGDSGLSEEAMLAIHRSEDISELNQGELEELIRLAKSSGSREVTQETLFGTETFQESNLMERVKLQRRVRRQLKRDKTIFGPLSRESRAAAIEEKQVGQIDPERAEKLATEAGRFEEVFESLSTTSGRVVDILNEHADAVARGDATLSEAADDATEEVRGALRDIIDEGGLDREIRRGAEGGEGARGAGAEPGEDVPAAQRGAEGEGAERSGEELPGGGDPEAGAGGARGDVELEGVTRPEEADRLLRRHVRRIENNPNAQLILDTSYDEVARALRNLEAQNALTDEHLELVRRVGDEDFIENARAEGRQLRAEAEGGEGAPVGSRLQDQDEFGNLIAEPAIPGPVKQALESLRMAEGRAGRDALELWAQYANQRGMSGYNTSAKLEGLRRSYEGLERYNEQMPEFEDVLDQVNRAVPEGNQSAGKSIAQDFRITKDRLFPEAATEAQEETVRLERIMGELETRAEGQPYTEELLPAQREVAQLLEENDWDDVPIEDLREAIGRHQPDIGDLSDRQLRARYVTPVRRARENILEARAGEEALEEGPEGTDDLSMFERPAEYREETTAYEVSRATAAWGTPDAANEVAEDVSQMSLDFSESTIDGVPSPATRVSRVQEGVKRSWVDIRDQTLETAEDAHRILYPFRHPRAERFHLILLDDQQEILSHVGLTSGAIDYAHLPDEWYNRLMLRAREQNASEIVVAHNHPSGDAYPSDDDLKWFKYLNYKLRQLEHMEDVRGTLEAHPSGRPGLEGTSAENVYRDARTQAGMEMMQGNIGPNTVGVRTYVIDNDHLYEIKLTPLYDDAPIKGFDDIVGRREVTELDPDAAPWVRTDDWTAAQGRTLKGPKDVRKLLGQTEGRPDQVDVLYLTTQNDVVALEPHKVDALENIEEWAPQQARKYGAAQIIIGVRTPPPNIKHKVPDAYDAALNQIKRLQRDPELGPPVRDVIYIHPETGEYMSALSRMELTPPNRGDVQTGRMVWERGLPENEEVTVAAVRHPSTGRVWEGSSHFDAIQKVPDDVPAGELEDGFMTTAGRFVDRKKAMAIENAVESDATGFQGIGITAEDVKRTPGQKARARADRAKEEFGTTDVAFEAGYVTRDGSALDFSLKSEGGPAGRRSEDHRAINVVFDESFDSAFEPVLRFLADGNIRVSASARGLSLDFSTTVSREQLERLQDMASQIQRVSEQDELLLDIEVRDPSTGEVRAQYVEPMEDQAIEGALRQTLREAEEAGYEPFNVRRLSQTGGRERPAAELELTDDEVLAPKTYPSAPRQIATDQANHIREVAEGLKEPTQDAVEEAAEQMAPMVRPGATLVPVPNSNGSTEANRALANAISRRVNGEVADVLHRAPTEESSFARRRQGKAGLTADEIETEQVKPLPDPENAYLVDNVVTTGATMTSARRALGEDLPALTYAKSSNVDLQRQMEDAARRGGEDPPQVREPASRYERAFGEDPTVLEQLADRVRRALGERVVRAAVKAPNGRTYRAGTHGQALHQAIEDGVAEDANFQFLLTTSQGRDISLVRGEATFDTHRNRILVEGEEEVPTAVREQMGGFESIRGVDEPPPELPREMREGATFAERSKMRREYVQDVLEYVGRQVPGDLSELTRPLLLQGRGDTRYFLLTPGVEGYDQGPVRLTRYARDAESGNVVPVGHRAFETPREAVEKLARLPSEITGRVFSRGDEGVPAVFERDRYGQGDMFSRGDAPAEGGEQFRMDMDEGLEEFVQGLNAAETQARRTVEQLQARVDDGSVTGEELAEYNEAVKLLRRNHPLRTDELIARARQKAADDPPPPQAEGQQDLFGPEAGAAVPRVLKQIAAQGVGGTVGAALDEENPWRGAAYGAILAGGLVALPRAWTAVMAKRRVGMAERVEDATRNAARGEPPGAPHYQGPSRMTDEDLEEAVNYEKFDTDPTGEERLQEEIRRMGSESGVKAPHKSVSLEEARAMAERLGLNPEDVLPQVAERMTGVELTALGNIVVDNIRKTIRMLEALNHPKITAEQEEILRRNLSTREQQNNFLLEKIVRGRSQKGRDLSHLRNTAKGARDPQGNLIPEPFYIQAKRYLGDEAFTTEHAAKINKFIQEDDVEGLAEYISSLRKATVTEKLVTLWKAGLMSAPITQIRNIAGNTSMALLEQLKDAPAWVGDRLISLAWDTGIRSKSLPRPNELASASWRGIKKGAKEAEQVLRTGIRIDDAAIKYDLTRKEVSFNNVFADVYTKTVFRSMIAGDRQFKGIAFVRALDEMARVTALNEGLERGSQAFKERVAELVKAPTDEMAAQAIHDAEISTFTNRNILGDIGVNIKRQVPLMEAVIPFTNTPANIALRTVDYSPFGFLRTAAGAFELTKAVAEGIDDAAKRKRVLMLQRKVADNFGRNVMGSMGVAALGYALAEAGLMTGSWPSDRSVSREWQRRGIPSHGIYIPEGTPGVPESMQGQWGTIENISPWGNIMAFGANLHDIVSNPETTGATDIVAGAGTSIVETVTEQSFLTGLSDALSAIQNPERASGDAFRRTIASFLVPNIVKKVNEGFQDRIYENETMGEEIGRRLPPGLQRGPFETPAQVDVFGREIEREGGVVKSLFDPFNLRRDEALEDEVIAEVSRVGASIPELQQDEGESLEEYRQRKRRVGQQLYVGIQELMSSGPYKAIPQVASRAIEQNPALSGRLDPDEFSREMQQDLIERLVSRIKSGASRREQIQEALDSLPETLRDQLPNPAREGAQGGRPR